MKLITSVKTQCNKSLNDLCKILLLTLTTTFTLYAQPAYNEQFLESSGAHDVAIDSGHAIVGDTTTNSVHFYDLNYTSFLWEKVQTLTNTDVNSLGFSVAIDGDVAIAGAPSRTSENVPFLYALKGNGDNVFLRYRESNDTWDEMDTLPERALYGAALAAVGNKIYAITGGKRGGFFETDDYSNGFYVYDIAEDSWSSVKNSSDVDINYFDSIQDGGASLVYDGGHYLYGTLGVRPKALSGDYSNDFQRFDLDNPDGGWVSMLSIPTYHDGGIISPDWGGCGYGCSLVTDGEFIYMTEGSTDGIFGSGDQSNKILKFTPAIGGGAGSGAWEDWSTATEDIGSGGSMTYDDGKLFVIVGKTGQWGGGNGSDVYNECVTLTGACTAPAGSTLPEKAGVGAAIVFGGEDLYAMRGTDTAAFWKYDSDANSWTTETLNNINTGADIPIGPGGAMASQVSAIVRTESAIVYKRDTTTGVWAEVAVLEDGTLDAGLGYDVGVQQSTDGTRTILAIGAPGADIDTIAAAGVVYIVKDFDTSEAIKSIQNNHEGFFGASIDMNAEHLIIGAPGEGVAYTFSYNASSNKYSSSGDITNLSENYFGLKVAINSDGNVSMMAASESVNTHSYFYTNDGTNWNLSYPPTDYRDGGGVDIDDDVYMEAQREGHLHFNVQTTSDSPVLSFIPTSDPEMSQVSIYKEQAMVNNPSNNRAVAIDVPCGIKPTHLVANEWAMVSVPCGDGTVGIDALFGDDMLSGSIYCPDDDPNTVCNWVMYKDGLNHTGKQADNVRVLESEAMKLGQGYWIIADHDVTLKADYPVITTRTISTVNNGANVPNDTIKKVKAFTLPTSSASIQKVMVGNPFPRAFNWSNVWFYRDATLHHIDDPLLTGAVKATAYVYDETQSGQPYRSVATNTPGISDKIEPMQGFWIMLDATAAPFKSNTIILPFEK